MPERGGQPQSCPEYPILSAENILLFAEGEKKGQSIPLYEEDLQAKWNAGELSLGSVENLFPNLDFRLSGFQRYCPWEEEEFYPLCGVLSGGGFSFSYEKIPFLQGTIELCEHFQISPYYLYSENAYLLRLEEMEAFSELARERGICGFLYRYFGRGKETHEKGCSGRVLFNKKGERQLGGAVFQKGAGGELAVLL